MGTIRWFNSSQPQTLQSAVILFYINGVLALLSGLNIITVFSFLGVAAAVGIAGEKKWGYILGMVCAVVPLALVLLAITLSFGNVMFSSAIISLLFRVILVVMLVHPMSRQYQRIWFK